MALIITASVLAFCVRTEAALPTEGTVVRVDFTSKVSYIQGGSVFGAAPSVGDLVTGFFTYDTTAPDLDPADPTRGIYRSGQIAVTIDGKLFQNEFVSEAVVFNFQDIDLDLFSVATGDVTDNVNELNILVDGVSSRPGSINFRFAKAPGVLTSDELPDPETLLLFEVDGFDVSQTDGNKHISFTDVQTLEARVVPEPSAFTLLGLGSLALVMGRRRR